MEMICNNADKCNSSCYHKFSHDSSLGCVNKCVGVIQSSIKGSKCISLKLQKLRKIGL